MRLNYSLDQKSIGDTIKRLQKLKSNYPKMQKEFLQRCCEWIRDQAIYYLAISDIGGSVVAEIESQFDIINDGNKAVLRNGPGRGYMIEFGVGLAGIGTYKGAVPPDYEYNIDTQYKNDKGEWIFRTNEADIDIERKNIISRTTNTVKTAGGPGVMFMYNAIADFRSKKIDERIWQDICKEYLA